MIIIKVYILILLLILSVHASTVAESVYIDISDEGSISAKATFNTEQLSQKDAMTIYLPIETDIGNSNLIITGYRVNNRDIPVWSSETVIDNKTVLTIRPEENRVFEKISNIYIEYKIPYPPIERRRNSDSLQIPIPYLTHTEDIKYEIEFPLSLEYEKCSIFLKNGLNLIKVITKEIGKSTLTANADKKPATQINIITPPKALNYNSIGIDIQNNFILPSPLIPALLFVSVIYLILREKRGSKTGYYKRDTPRGEDILLHHLIWNGKLDRYAIPTAVIESAKEGYLKIYNDYSHTIPFIKLTKRENSFNSEEMRFLHNDILFDKSDTFIFSSKSAKKADKDMKLLEGIVIDRAMREGYFTAEPKTIHNKITLYIALPVMAITIYILYYSYLYYGTDITIWLLTYIGTYFFTAYITVKDLKIQNLEQWWQKLLLLLFPFLMFPSPENMSYLEDMFIPIFIPVLMIFVSTLYLYRRFIPLSKKGKELYSMLERYRERINPAGRNFIPTNTKKIESILTYISLFNLSDRWKKYLGDSTLYISWFEGDIWDFIKRAWRSVDSISIAVSDDDD